MSIPQKFNMPHLTCNYKTHEGEPIKSICLRKNCNKPSAQCYSCTFEFHKECINCTKMIKEIPQLLQPLQQMKKVMSQLLVDVNQVVKELDNLIENILKPIDTFLELPNLSNLNILGIFLKEENELRITHLVEEVEKKIKILFQDWRVKIKSNDVENQIQEKKVERKSAQEWFNEGVALHNLNRFQEAIDCYKEAIKIDPKYKVAWNNQGIALYNLNRFQKAIDCYKEAIKIDPKDKDLWNNQGVALYNLNRFQEAIDCYKEAIKIDPKFQPAIDHIKLAEKYLKK